MNIDHSTQDIALGRTCHDHPRSKTSEQPTETCFLRKRTKSEHHAAFWPMSLVDLSVAWVIFKYMPPKRRAGMDVLGSVRYPRAVAVRHGSLRDQCMLKGGASRQAYLTENSSSKSCDDTTPE